MALRVTRFYKTTIPIDGELLKVRIQKLTIDQWTRFVHEFERLGKVFLKDKLDLRPRSGEEDLTAEEIAARRYGELSAEARAAREVEELAEAERGNQFAKDVIAQYVTLEPDQVFDEDANQYLTTGAEMLEHFGSRPDVLRDLVAEIFLQNRLSEEDKKKLSLLRVSLRTWNEPTPDRGTRPASTAEPAPNAATASDAVATDAPDETPSGSTPTSRSSSAPS